MTKALTLAPLSWLPIPAEKTSSDDRTRLGSACRRTETPATIAAVAAADNAKPRSYGAALRAAAR